MPVIFNPFTGNFDFTGSSSGGGGSQTPWTSDIDGAGHQLLDTGNIATGSLGSETIVNPNFATNTVWGYTGGWSYDGANQAAKFTSNGSPGSVAQTFGSLQAAGVYRYSITVSNRVGSGTANHFINLLNNSGGSIVTKDIGITNGTYTGFIYSPQQIRYIFVTAQTLSGTVTFNDAPVSFKLVTPQGDVTATGFYGSTLSIGSTSSFGGDMDLGGHQINDITYLTDPSLVVAASIQSRILYDSSGNVSLWWGNRILRDSGGNDVLNYVGDGTASTALSLSPSTSTFWNTLILNSLSGVGNQILQVDNSGNVGIASGFPDPLVVGNGTGIAQISSYAGSGAYNFQVDYSSIGGYGGLGVGVYALGSVAGPNPTFGFRADWTYYSGPLTATFVLGDTNGGWSTGTSNVGAMSYTTDTRQLKFGEMTMGGYTPNTFIVDNANNTVMIPNAPSSPTGAGNNPFFLTDMATAIANNYNVWCAG